LFEKMKPSSKKTSSDVVRSGNLADPPLDASDASESEDSHDEEEELLVVAAAARSGAKTKKQKSVAASALRKRKAAAAVRTPRKASSAAASKVNSKRNALFPIPESIGVEDDDMESSSSSDEYGAPQEDDDLDVLWPSVVQAGARLSEARTWTTRPSQPHYPRKRPRVGGGDDEDAYSSQPLIQHYDPVPRPTALAALKERMRTFVTDALLPVTGGPGEEESQHLQNSLSAHSSSGASTLDFTEGCHRRLVEAIFEIGMSHASPAVIMEHMIFPTTDWLDDSGHRIESLIDQVTSERVKSHLQKYRKNKHKSKEEFMREYDRWTQKALTVVGGISAAARTNLVTAPTAVLHMMGHGAGGAEDASSSKSSTAEQSHRLLGGDLPAYLTFSVMLEEEHCRILREEGGIPTAATLQRRSSHSTDSSNARAAADGSGMIATQQTATLPSAREYAQSLSGARVLLPILSEEERQSSLGISISHVVGLFYSMSHALMKERKKEQQKSKATTETNATPPPRSEFRPVEDNATEQADSETRAAAPSATNVTNPPAARGKHPRNEDYYAASATPTTTSTVATAAAGDPDPERRRADEDRYATEPPSYAAYGQSQQYQHHASYESSHYHHSEGGTHPSYPPPPPPRYPPPPPPHYSNHPPPSDGSSPYGSHAYRGGHYGL
jgi:hypothetical protein